jgi:hypothetical protein
VPLEVAEVAAELVQIASELAQSGNPRLRGDAMTAMFLAAAAARAAAVLVCENLAGEGEGEDPRLVLAATLLASVDAAEQAAMSVYPALTPPPLCRANMQTQGLLVLRLGCTGLWDDHGRVLPAALPDHDSCVRLARASLPWGRVKGRRDPGVAA